MQHPVGYRYNPDTGRAEMNDFVAVLLNKVQLVTFPHVVLSAYMTGAAFVVGVAFWQLRPASDGRRGPRRCTGRRCASGAVVVLVAGLGSPITGDMQGKIMTEVQPMKMAAAEALYETETPPPSRCFTIGSLDGTRGEVLDQGPGLLSFLATGSTDGEVEGINELREQYRGVRPGPGCGVLLAGRLHARTSRSPTGPSG